MKSCLSGLFLMSLLLVAAGCGQGLNSDQASDPPVAVEGSSADNAEGTQESPSGDDSGIEFAEAVDPGELVQAPDTYKVKFETSKGDFVMEVTRAWSPQGADHFHRLVKARFYNGVRFSACSKSRSHSWLSVELTEILQFKSYGET